MRFRFWNGPTRTMSYSALLLGVVGIPLLGGCANMDRVREAQAVATEADPHGRTGQDFLGPQAPPGLADRVIHNDEVVQARYAVNPNRPTSQAVLTDATLTKGATVDAGLQVANTRQVLTQGDWHGAAVVGGIIRDTGIGVAGIGTGVEALHGVASGDGRVSTVNVRQPDLPRVVQPQAGGGGNNGGGGGGAALPAETIDQIRDTNYQTRLIETSTSGVNNYWQWGPGGEALSNLNAWINNGSPVTTSP